MSRHITVTIIITTTIMIIIIKRPIAVGYTWRRLAAKGANSHAVSRLSQLLGPIQLGVGIPGGAEAAVHATRLWVTTMPEDSVLVKLDFTNAFNTLRRD